jgi:hypothetical protein
VTPPPPHPEHVAEHDERLCADEHSSELEDPSLGERRKHPRGASIGHARAPGAEHGGQRYDLGVIGDERVALAPEPADRRGER